jgi:hypothetical protein
MKFNESPHVIPGVLLQMSEEGLLELLRGVRSAYLSDTDWTQLPDAPLTDTERAQWAEYRQALRDITETYADNLLEAEFPVRPDQTA